MRPKTAEDHEWLPGWTIFVELFGYWLCVNDFLPSPCFLLFSNSVRHISTQSQPMKSRTRCC